MENHFYQLFSIRRAFFFPITNKMSSANRSEHDDLLLVQVTLVKTSGTLEEIRREDARTLDR